MPRPRFDNLSEEKQERIIEAAGREFGEKGYLAASVNVIIDEADISKGAFYYYFDDKADLFATVVGHVARAVFGGDTVDYSQIDRDDFWPSMKDMGQRSVDYSREHPWVWEVARSLHDAPEELHPVLAPYLDIMMGVMMDFLQRGQQLGLIRTDVPLDLIAVMISALDQAIDRWLIEKHEELSTEEMATISDTLMEMTEKMLAPPSEGDES